jgi:hypothetical protein
MVIWIEENYEKNIWKADRLVSESGRGGIFCIRSQKIGKILNIKKQFR